MEDLRECPCCGKPGAVKITNKALKNGVLVLTQGWVGCPACGLYIQWTHDPSGAIRKWNRRDGGTLRLDGGVPHQSPAATASPRGSRAAAAGTGDRT